MRDLRIGCTFLALAIDITVHWFINILLFLTATFSRRQSVQSPQFFKFQTLGTRLSSHLAANTNASISSTTYVNFLTWGTNTHALKCVYDLILLPDNIVYFWCKTIRFLGSQLWLSRSQWRTQEFFRGGAQQISWGQRIENGDLGAVAP
jgi:hypothetical protein